MNENLSNSELEAEEGGASVVTNIEGAKQINIQNGKGSSVATADEAIGWSNEYQRFM